MNGSVSTLKLDEVRIDGDTQVRETLDPAWVDELVGFYQQEHDVPPVSVTVDRTGVYFVYDGFHRLSARRKAGFGDIQAHVISGEKEDAKFLATAANKSGRTRTAGDKKRAIIMARQTPAGSTMGIRELAKHVGVDQGWVSRVIAECCHDNQDQGCVTKTGLRAQQAALRARVVEAVKADPDRPQSHIAAEFGCSVDVVRDCRRGAGLPQASPGAAQAQKGEEARRKIRAEIRRNPDASVAQLASVGGCSAKIVCDVRKELGLARNLPSAPMRKGGDSRDKAEVIPVRPAPGVESKVADIVRAIERLSNAEREQLQAIIAKKWSAAFESKPVETGRPTKASSVPQNSRAVWAEVRSLIVSHVEVELGHLDQVECQRHVGRFAADIKAVLADVSAVVVRQRKANCGLGEMRARANHAEACRACDVLGVKRPKRHEPVNSDSARRERKKLLRAYHPDVNGGNDATRAQFDAVNEAFKIVENYNEEISNARSNGHASNGVAHA